MTALSNLNDNNALAALSQQAPSHVTHAIQHASNTTGVDFAYLMQQASAESSFNPGAKAKTSSATGLYQFIESTWMNMVEKHGSKYGINAETMSKQEILDLRYDPKISSKLAAEFAKDNQDFLETHWGGDIGSTELYFAHFMGAGGAAGFLKARDDNPLQAAADLFPKAAKANRNVFYESGTGRAKSLEDVYAHFDKKFSIDSAPTVKSNLFVDQPDNQDWMNARMAHAKPTNQNLMDLTSLVQNPIELMILAELKLPINGHKEKVL